MSKFTKFDKTALRLLRTEIDFALEQIGKTYGISLTAGNASFNADTATFKLDCALLNSEGIAETKEMIDLKAIYPQMVGKGIILSSGTKGTIVGYSRRAKKYPFLVKTTEGIFKITETQAGAGPAFIRSLIRR